MTKRLTLMLFLFVSASAVCGNTSVGNKQTSKIKNKKQPKVSSSGYVNQSGMVRSPRFYDIEEALRISRKYKR